MLQAAETIGTATALKSALQGALKAPEIGAGYVPSKITITEQGLAHVFERHVAGGAKSAGKSIFYDNVTLTRLIADAGDAVTPVSQPNGNLAYIVDAGRTIGVDRTTGAPTSVYTVITRPSGELVTAFPGTP